MSLPARATARTRDWDEGPKRSLVSELACALIADVNERFRPSPELDGVTGPSGPATDGPDVRPGRAATRLQPSQWNIDSFTLWIGSSLAALIALALTYPSSAPPG